MTRLHVSVRNVTIASLIVVGTTAFANANSRVGGTLTVQASNLPGGQGQDLVSFVFKRPYSGMQPLVATCDPANGNGVYATFAQYTDDPCNLGPEALLEPGFYRVYSGIFEPGAVTPSHCSVQTIDLAGNMVIEVTEWGSCDQWFL